MSNECTSECMSEYLFCVVHMYELLRTEYILHTNLCNSIPVLSPYPTYL